MTLCPGENSCLRHSGWKTWHGGGRKISRAGNQSFIADAAHELRSPVAALSIQVELAQRATQEVDRQVSLSEVQAGVMRLTHHTQQRLTLARLEPE